MPEEDFDTRAKKVASDLDNYVKKLEVENKKRKIQILEALKQGSASQHELRDRLRLGHDDEMICDMCWMLCEELKSEGKVVEKRKTWSLA